MTNQEKQALIDFLNKFIKKAVKTKVIKSFKKDDEKIKALEIVLKKHFNKNQEAFDFLKRNLKGAYYLYKVNKKLIFALSK